MVSAILTSGSLPPVNKLPIALTKPAPAAITETTLNANNDKPTPRAHPKGGYLSYTPSLSIYETATIEAEIATIASNPIQKVGIKVNKPITTAAKPITKSDKPAPNDHIIGGYVILLGNIENIQATANIAPATNTVAKAPLIISVVLILLRSQTAGAKNNIANPILKLSNISLFGSLIGTIN